MYEISPRAIPNTVYHDILQKNITRILVHYNFGVWKNTRHPGEVATKYGLLVRKNPAGYIPSTHLPRGV